MSFDAHEENIGRIFAGETKFSIPRNQRKYVWTEKQWRELYGDIIYTKKQIIEAPNITHFLGSFVLQEEENFFSIIDGQQRITTLFIFLASICVVFNELNSNEEHGITRQNIQGNIGLKSQFLRISNPDIENLDAILLKACTYVEDINMKNIFGKYSIDKANISNKKVIECFYFFYSCLKEFTEIQELVQIREVVLRTKVIHIASEDELDCYDIFEILNARGVDLEESELLKNYIYKYSKPKFNIDESKRIWLKIEENMEQCNNNMEQFLSHFVSYKYKKPTKEEKVFRIVKSSISKEDVSILLSELYANSERYKLFYNPSLSENPVFTKCFSYFKMLNHRQFRPLFMSILDVQNEKQFKVTEIEKIFLFLRNFSFAFTIVLHENGNALESKIYKLAQQIYIEKTIESISSVKDELEKYYPDFKSFESAFFSLNYTNKSSTYTTSTMKRKIKYIFEEIEQSMSLTNETLVNMETCNIEHIMCDSPSPGISWKIGNLLLVSKKLNSRMADKPFSEKKEILVDSQLNNVKKFMENYGNNTAWVDEDIEKRTKFLCDLAYNKIWKI